MATVEEIGTAAGIVWRFLRAEGPATLTSTERSVSLPRSLVSMALGWLAREGKLVVEIGERSVHYSVTD